MEIIYPANTAPDDIMGTIAKSAAVAVFGVYDTIELEWNSVGYDEPNKRFTHRKCRARPVSEPPPF